ncbi:MAG: SIMPL domain-containing protein [Halieaceae bacterium]|nr:SIMPL domain-containing protein [Halieaceae bacterium]
MSSANFRRFILLTATIAVLGVSLLTQADSKDLTPRILVIGVGRVDVAPDMAILTLTVTREAATARAALDANSRAMSDVLAALETQGIDKRDLQTSNFSIQPKYLHRRPNSAGEHQPPKIVGYTVRNGLTVRVRDISNLGAILDKSVTLGVNEGGNIEFTSDDPTVAIAQARSRAVRDAIAKANTLAEAAGLKVGKVLEISEQPSFSSPMRRGRSEMAMSKVADAVPIAAGENTYEVTINASFSIDQ